MSPHVEDPDDDEAEILDVGRSRRRGTVVVAVIGAALLGGLLLRGPGSNDPTVGTSTTSATSTTEAPVAVSIAPALEQLVFLDDVRAVALREDCVDVPGGPSCTRTLLAGDDAGTSFESRGELPSVADPARRLLADPSGLLAVVDDVSLSVLVHSRDGGVTWDPVPLVDGPPAALPPGVPALTPLSGPCAPRCGRASWVDIATGVVHPLPTAPGDADGGWTVVAAPGDGLLAARDQAGGVAVSTDRGRSWTRVDLPPELAGRSGPVRLAPADDGRLYAVVDLVDAGGVLTRVGLRSDDAGATWTDLDHPSRAADGLPRLSPDVLVVDGELLTTNSRGDVLRSTDRGAGFAVVPGAPPVVGLSQDRPGGPVLATVYGDGGPRYWVSVDGLTWRDVFLAG